MSNPKTNSYIRIPGYRIESEIGRGGIATVYLAVQESLDRKVALKVMSPALVAEQKFTERFILEGHTIAQLNHPGIVTIHDIASENYQTYIAMEYLPGGTLKDKMRHPIHEGMALSIVLQMANAIAYAHDNGIVHRDVKPENIMFRKDGAGVLTDFGIAKIVGIDSQLTHTGIIVGTPRYISPEQANGRGTDPRSDIYALGVILYEMLVGKPPYGNTETIALLYSHVNDPIPDLPEKYRYLQPLVNATMAKDPDERVLDCHKLGEMIRHTQQGARFGKGIVTSEFLTDSPQGTTGGIRVHDERTQGLERGALWPVFFGSVGALTVTFLLAGMLREIFDPKLELGIADSITQTAEVAVMPQPDQDTLPIRSPETPAPDQSPPPGASVRLQLDAEVAKVEKPSVVEDRAPIGVPVARDLLVIAEPQSPTDTGRGSDISEIATPAVVSGATTNVVARGRPTVDIKVQSKALTGVQPSLRLAEQQVALGKVDEPAGDNALETYRQILTLVHDHPQALSGLNDIARYFLDKGRELKEENRFQEALVLVKRGLTAVPAHQGLAALQTDISLRMAAQEEFLEAEKYFWGKGVPRDLESAVTWYRKAAEKGHVGAQYSLGVAYADGSGIPRDEVEGLRWLRRAAIQGNEDAQYNLSLGMIFGPDPDPDLASEWITKLADKNYGPAFQVLGWMYSNGVGVKQSIKESIRWNVKHVMLESSDESLSPKWIAQSWDDRFQSAVKRTELDQRPQEPN